MTERKAQATQKRLCLRGESIQTVKVFRPLVITKSWATSLLPLLRCSAKAVNSADVYEPKRGGMNIVASVLKAKVVKVTIVYE